MATDTFLSPEEIQQLTAARHRGAQINVLNAMGIEHRVRPDGSVVILRAHINKVFDGDATAKHKTKQAVPNWSAIE